MSHNSKSSSGWNMPYLPGKAITTLSARDSKRLVIDARELHLTRGSGNHYFLACAIWGYLRSMPGRAWSEILARMLAGCMLVIYMHLSLWLQPPAHHFERGFVRGFQCWLPIIPITHLLHRTTFLAKVCESHRGLQLHCTLHFRSSCLCAHISKTHFTRVEILQFLQSLPSLGHTALANIKVISGWIMDLSRGFNWLFILKVQAHFSDPF